VLDKAPAAPGLLERRAGELARLVRRYHGTHGWSEVALSRGVDHGRAIRARMPRRRR
jgi:hypothetical protein